MGQAYPQGWNVTARQVTVPSAEDVTCLSDVSAEPRVLVVGLIS